MDTKTPMEHPLRLFAFCPVCGSEHFQTNSKKSKVCHNCGFEYFVNPATSTVAIIEDGEGKVLVARRAKNPACGTLDLPGGFCDCGESAERGVIREVMEETGLRVTSVEYLFSLPNEYPYSGMSVFTTDLFFQCRVEPGTPTAMDDVAGLAWARWEDLNPEDFGLDSIRKGMRRLLAKRGLET